jgi:hypothetical protein
MSSMRLLTANGPGFKFASQFRVKMAITSEIVHSVYNFRRDHHLKIVF